MALTRGGALVANVAAVVKLTGQQDLANLETDGELTLADLLTTANDWVYDRLETKGDPTKLTNQARYERAVAWYFLSLLAETGSIRVDGESSDELARRYMERAERHFSEVWPRFSDSDDPRSGAESIPRVANVSRYPQLGRRDFYDDLNRRR